MQNNQPETSENRVFVESMRGKPLMPTTCRKARLLLKEGKAEIIKYNPFTIKLKYPTGETVQPIDIGVSVEGNTISVALLSQNKVLHRSNIKLRPGVKGNINARAALRHARRNRQKRYRKRRTQNRKNQDRFISPSSRNKVRHIIRWVSLYVALVPTAQLHITKADTVVTNKNPQRKSSHKSTRDRIFARDGRRCAICGCTTGPFRIHHVRYKSKGGSNIDDNLIVVCDNCHTGKNHKPGGILDELRKSRISTTKKEIHPISRIILIKLMGAFPLAEYVEDSTVLNQCEKLNLQISDSHKAIAVTGIDYLKANTRDILLINQYRKNGRSLHNATPIKGRKEKNRTASRRNTHIMTYRNWVKNDKVLVFNKYVGFITGFGNFVACVKDINGNYITDSTRKNYSVNLSSLKLLCHNNNWQYQTVKYEIKE